MSISEQQALTFAERPVNGPMWVAFFNLPPPPEDDVRKLLLRVIDSMGDGDSAYTQPFSDMVRMQWIGHRRGVGRDEPTPPIPEFKKYERLEKENPGPTVILFIYGGAF
ncbi:hypothetical protein MMC17_002911 [Xylographa soralifera]|nr:hypothetical protein [Xylographa soralifera]